MLISKILLGALGLVCGIATAAGVVALVSSLGITPRMVGKSTTAKHILLYEDFIMAGAVIGTIFAVFNFGMFFLGTWFLILGGIFAGIFVGCLAAALAEVLQVWPILFRRTHLKYGLGLSMLCFSIGKAFGGLYYFFLLK
ncbi:MAG: stage V sporulation protein AB [Eubacterium sp.]|nr:stage V sporulation protein AB [Eubacterium sp.]